MHETRHFRIGAVGVTLNGPGAVLDLYAKTYSPFASTEPVENALVFDITPHGRSRYCVSGGPGDRTADLTPRSAVAEIEALLNQQVIRHLQHFVQYHAAVLSWRGDGVIFPADSGTGKSTLSAALINRGWQFLSDEFALVDPHTLYVHPFPKALCVKEPGRHMVGGELARHTTEPFILRHKYKRYYIPPWTLGAHVIGSACPVRWLFFLSRKPGTAAQLFTPTTAEAVVYTYRTGLNTLHCGHSGLQTTVALVNQARCHQLNVGPVDATCQLIEDTLDATRAADKVSA